MSQTVCAGQSVTFSVNAGVTTSPTYQWRKNSVDIPGATNATYTVAATVAGDAGSYDVVVSGSCAGTATSTVAALTINALPKYQWSAGSGADGVRRQCSEFHGHRDRDRANVSVEEERRRHRWSDRIDLHDTGDSDGKCRHLPQSW
ncbi:MAG: immunoglobulin domain-containing protein [Cyclobacteriaceae bacterium]|nr:immunoglobulin domain-containing protein [Cyclobacteriaceae bacterium]